MNAAWFCPSCQKYHAPHVDTCPGVGAAQMVPSDRLHPLPQQCSTCGMIWDGVMGYVCPRIDCPSRISCSTFDLNSLIRVGVANTRAQ